MNEKKSFKFKLIFSQKLKNEQELTSSAIYIYLDQRVYTSSNDLSPLRHNNNMRISCKTFFKAESITNQHTKPFCLNMTVNLNDEFKLFYPNQNLKNKIKFLSDFKFRVYASVINNDFQLIPNGMQTNKNILVSNYVLLNAFDHSHIKNLILNDFEIPLHYCHLLEIDSLKLEISFKSNLNAEKNFQIENYNMYVNDRVEIFTIDLNLSSVCTRKKSSILESIQYFSNQPVLAESTNTKQLESTNSNQSLKVHVLLPIILSVFFVTFFILIAIFFRR